jgi:putative tryptophan/tyrosine transport system substrate-binding protein
MPRSEEAARRRNAAPVLIAAALISASLSLISSSCVAKEKKVRVGVLCCLDYFAPTFDGFKERLAELGYREGERIDYDYRRTGMDMAKARVALDELARSKVDLILAFPTEGALEAKRVGAEAGIGVVFADSNIEGVGLVDSIRAPGKGITGVRYPGPDMTVKRLEVLSQLAPLARRYFIPYMRGIPVVPPQLAALESAAAAAGIVLEPRPFDGAAELEAYLDALPAAGPAPFDAVLMIAEPLAVMEDCFVPLAAFAARRRIPIGGATMRAGGYSSLFGVSTDNRAVGRQAADIARKIFLGTKPGDIPVVSAEYRLEIDVAAAAVAGIAVPDGLLKRADKVAR